jgi:RHS repeat-associated protein
MTKKLRALCILILWSAALCSAQDETPTQVTVQNRTGDMPYSATIGSDIEHVDLTSLSLAVTIPIATAKGRGMDSNFILRYEPSFWVVATRSNTMGTYQQWNIERRNYLPSETVGLGWEINQPRLTWVNSQVKCQGPDPTLKAEFTSHFIYYDSDGGKHLLATRYGDGDCNGSFILEDLQGPDMTGQGVYASMARAGGYPLVIKADGTQITPPPGAVPVGNPLAPWEIALGQFQDADGNLLQRYPGGTDTLGRPFVTRQDGTNQIIYKVNDSNGTPQNYTVNFINIPIQTSFGVSGAYGTILEIGGGTRSVISSIVLPNGQSYQFQYETGGYGELTRIDLPTGGYITYTWDTISAGDHTRRYVSGRTVHVDGQSYPWTFAPVCAAGDYRCISLTTTVTDPLNKQSTYAVDGTSGIITDVQIYDGPALGTPMRKYHIDPQSFIGPYGSEGGQATVPIRVTTTLQNGAVRKTEFEYEQFTYPWSICPETGACGFAATNGVLAKENFTTTRGNIAQIREYDWGPVPSSYGAGVPGSLLRRVKRTYLHNDVPAYLSYNIVDKVSSETICDGVSACAGTGDQAAQTKYEYDQYLPGDNPLQTTTGAAQHSASFSASFTTRGNVTRIKHWRNTDGALLITTYGYDDLGNIRTIKDPLGHTTTYSYDDSFTTTCLGITGNTQAYVSGVTNAMGHRIHISRYGCTGLVSQHQDENDLRNSRPGVQYQYDSLGRPTSQTLPDGSLARTTQYNDIIPASKTDTEIISAANDPVAPNLSRITQTEFDGLGRPRKTAFLSDPEGATYTRVAYDALGRKLQEWNATRCDPDVSPTSCAGETTFGVTSYEYDVLGRTTKVIPPDGTSLSNNVATQYDGNSITVTDQAGKQRRSFSDGLGRLMEVDEPSPTGIVPAVSATAYVDVSGTEQSRDLAGSPAVAATGSVQINGNEKSVITQGQRYCAAFSSRGVCVDWEYTQVTRYDSGTVSLSVNGFAKSVSYNSASSGTSIASALVTAFNNDAASPVSLQSSGALITILAKTAGTSGNTCSLTASVSTNDATNFPVPSFSTALSGATLSQGANAVAPSTVYDGGTVSISVDGLQKSVSFGQGKSSTDLAATLASLFNIDNSSQVTASAAGGRVSFVAKTAGSGANQFGLTVGATTSQGSYFAAPSFGLTSSGPTLGGGADQTTNGGLKAPYITLYAYDALGNLTCVEQHGDVSGTGCSSPSASDATSAWRVRRFTYDSLSQLRAASNPETGTISYAYNDDGILISRTDARGFTTNYSPSESPIDSLHRVTKKTYTNGDPSVTFSFDDPTVANSIGRRTGMTDAAGSSTWTYDFAGRVLTNSRTVAGVTKSTSVQYALNGFEEQVTYPSGTVVQFKPSAAGREIQARDITHGITYADLAKYAPAGQLTDVVLGGVITGKISFNSRLQPIHLLYTTGSLPTSAELDAVSCATSATGSLMDRVYAFGIGSADNGNVNSIQNCRDLNRTQNFTYDDLNRISQAYTTGANWGETFTIDPWGNLTSRAQVTGKVNYEPLSAPSTIKNQIAGYTYDAGGNMLTDVSGASTISYDSENRISTAGVWSYLYDGNGDRVAKKASNSITKVYWLGLDGDGLDESDGTGSIGHEYAFFNGRRVARRDLPSGTVEYYLSDHLGSASVVTSASGAPQQESDYFPYGGEIPISGADSNVYKFAGKERDTETGFDYFGARYYGSDVGRFTSSDPIHLTVDRILDPQRLNLYAYVRNNPVKYVDPDGQDLHIAVTNQVVGQSYVNRKPGGRSAPGQVSESAPLYRVTVRNDSGSSRQFSVTRDSNVKGPIADTRGTYGKDHEAPPGQYHGHTRRDGARGFRIELSDSKDGSTIKAPDGSIRENVQMHIGPGCSEGCMLLPGGKPGRDNFESNINQLVNEDKENNKGTDIYVTIEDRNQPSKDDAITREKKEQHK